MAQNIAASSASSATKSFFGGITGTLGVIVGLILVLCLCCGGIAFMSSMNKPSTNSTTNPSSNTSTEQTNPTPQETNPTPQPPREPINLTFSGKSNQDTESFTLRGGSAKMSAKTTGGTYGTYTSITLEKEGENTFLNGLTGSRLSISTEGKEDGTGETTIRGLEDGTYYISVISGVDWTVTITQE